MLVYTATHLKAFPVIRKNQFCFYIVTTNNFIYFNIETRGVTLTFDKGNNYALTLC